ncbi:MAG TPA: hypothetical protein VKV28_15790 [Candidatus Binataceae bacterium]|nr:hypothetical protein [Candidatus Binataceae bacterium]
MTAPLRSFETELPTAVGKLAGLAAPNRESIAKAEAIDLLRRVVLDIDSTQIPLYGEQERKDRGVYWRAPCERIPGPAQAASVSTGATPETKLTPLAGPPCPALVRQLPNLKKKKQIFS